ncbi:MAG: hypothetical protein EON88_02160 [Brevundimonas sp.]|nr:MAG: hypothetical protein EON88_02160 [Brevundimonas sp.]
MVRAILIASAVALAACGQAEPPVQAPAPAPGTEPGSTPPSSPTPPPVTAPAPLTPAGPAQAIALNEQAELQWSASVVKLQTLTSGAKVFGVAGGDPAMNGLQTYIGFFESPAEGWRIYPVGDVLDFTVLNAAPNRVDLQVSESVMDPATQQIGSRTRRVIVAWTGPLGAAPTAVTVTPAQ